MRVVTVSYTHLDVYKRQAEDLYFTPEQFGGSKEKGIELFKKALDQFKTYKLKSSLDPNWGQGEASYFVSQAK